MNICYYCAREFKAGKNSNGFYCSSQCHADSRSQKVVDDWLLNQTVENFYTADGQPRNAIRRYFINKNNCQCTRCGWGEKHHLADLPALEIEHIDGNWENCTIDNIDIICPNCHSLTDTYKARNRGNGRKHRREKLSKLGVDTPSSV